MNPAYDLIVVGEGVAGLTCAAECTRRGLKVATCEAAFFGGLVVNVNELARFEEAGGLSGMDHAGVLAASNRKAGVRSVTSEVSAVRRAHEGFEVETAGGKLASRFVVIATGARLQRLGVPGENEYEGRGVSHCADCDAPMFTDAEVVVAGSGDWALHSALLLARESAVVHLMFGEQAPTACREYIDRARAEPRIRFHPGVEIQEILGDRNGMTGVAVRREDGATVQIGAAGLFAVPGLVPNGELAPPQVERDERNFLKVDANLETAVSGLWAIGQVRSGFGGWLEHAAADARCAADCVKARAG